ncbi:hypothetical protein [Luteibacter sp.]|uniref:hypothetical protein n=1 Tax=Luteibacter sp. TaxID=1886636 RepID=UPI002F416F22
MKIPFIAGPALLCLSIAQCIWAKDSPSTVDDLLREANERVARGESPDTVEKSLRELMNRQGVETHGTPPAWDVFARARWRREETSGPDPGTEGKQGLSDSPPSFVTIVNKATE